MKIKLLLLIICTIPIIIIYEIKYNEKEDYLSIGDGLSLGWTYYGGIGYGYSDYIKNYLEENNKLKTFNKSFSRKDKSVKELIKDIEKNNKTISNGKKVFIQNAINNAELITISIGNNEMSDILKYNYSKSDSYIKINKISNEINYLLNKIRDISHEKIIFIGYYSYGKNNNELVKYTNLKIKNICDKYNIIFIDTDKIIGKDIKYLPNTIENYPSYSGYKKIGKYIVNKAKL